MRMPTSPNHSFAQVPKANIQRSKFNRSHAYKTTFDEGGIYPFYLDEALPGDTFKMRATMFARLATPITPFMDNLYLDTFFFFVPLRLLWDNFQKFMGEQTNPGDSTSYLVPTLSPAPVGGFTQGSLFDYMTLPTKVAGIVADAFWCRAYNLIWNTWFRDQNLQNSSPIDRSDGPDNLANYLIRRRGKRHDYFTSCLPFVQKGPAVTIPLGSAAPVIGNGLQPQIKQGASPFNLQVTAGTGSINAASFSGSTGAFSWVTNANTGLYTDLSTATAATINSLRQAVTLQQFYEVDARGGTRYTEIILSHFGVVSPDARLQRPEYLGGGSVPLNINAVAQTSANTSQPTPQGNLAAFGTATLHGDVNGFTKSFVEHGVLLGLMSVRADLTYQQGMDRMFTRQTRVDYFWPSFAHIGEQAVLNQEIYAQGTSTDQQVFGYQERYAEYRYKPSKITGLFRSNATGTLDYWHLAQNFATLPVLGATFIEENPPVSRVVAVPSQPHFILDSFMDLECARPMPVYGVPGIRRF